MNNTNGQSLLSVISKPYVLIASRVILGGMLLSAGILKLPYISTLIWEIEQYHILPDFLIKPYASVLPFAEIVLGLMLLLGIFTRVSAGVSGLVVISFTIAKLNAQVQGLGIDVCPCLGPMIPLFLGPSLAIDFVLLICAVLLIAVKSEYLSLSGWIAKRRRKQGGT